MAWARSTILICWFCFVEERLQALQPREREQDVELALPLGDEVGLVGEVVEVRPLDRLPREHDADRERHADGEDDDDDYREEETPAQRREPPHAHGATALYPAPRTVLMMAGRPSFRLSCPTWTSTVRVPPG